MERDIKSKIKEEVQAQMEARTNQEDAAVPPISLSPNSQKKLIVESVRLHMDKEKEKDDRKGNIIIFELEETNTNVKTEADKEDRIKFEQICNILEVDINQEEVMRSQRLGKKKQKTEPDHY